jgi:hypothetical protein
MATSLNQLFVTEDSRVVAGKTFSRCGNNTFAAVRKAVGGRGRNIM